MTVEEAIKFINKDNVPCDNCYMWEKCKEVNYQVLSCRKEEAFEMAIEALKRMKAITAILDDTDFHNAESLNEIGEDKGYYESICAISVEVDGRYRWME